MNRNNEVNERAALWIERLAWNAAAVAVLAVMMLILLSSLRWLDRIAPEATRDASVPAVSSAPVDILLEPLAAPAPISAIGAAVRDLEATVADVNRPSG